MKTLQPLKNNINCLNHLTNQNLEKLKPVNKSRSYRFLAHSFLVLSLGYSIQANALWVDHNTAYSCTVTKSSGSFGTDNPPLPGDSLFIDLNYLKDEEGPTLQFYRNEASRNNQPSIALPSRFKEIWIVMHRRFRAALGDHIVELQVVSQHSDQAQLWIFSSGYSNSEPRSDAYLDCFAVK